MAVYQINVWVCEVCGKTESTSTEITSPFGDSMISPPNDTDWPYVNVGGQEKHACPECGKKYPYFDLNLAKLHPR